MVAARPGLGFGASLLGVLSLICFGPLIGFTSYVWLFRHAPTSLVTTYACVNPLIARLRAADRQTRSSRRSIPLR
ncbi:MAG TPA: hypothetical protein VGB83_10050 [Actinomycetota bacterium]